MDKRSPSNAPDPIAVTGRGLVVGSPVDPTPWLRVRKNRKFMGAQDDLAVAAAGRAAAGRTLGERAGLFLAVGYIPFEQSDLEVLLAGSTDRRGFSMARFSTDGYNAVNPLLTFRCLTNMPAFHVSVNFDIQGPYFVTYPGAGQFYVALEEAVAQLRSGRIDVALVGAVAHQTNFLVRRHFARLDVPVTKLVDAAAFLVLERGSRGLAVLKEIDVAYRAHDPFEESIEHREEGADGAMGPVSLAAAVASAPPGIVRHELRSRDGIVASSTWEVLA